MDKVILMTCRHTANAHLEGKPACAICSCVTVDRVIDIDVTPTEGLEGRQCQCPECGSLVPSAWTLPFFKYRPEEEYDSAYDGCWGWN